MTSGDGLPGGSRTGSDVRFAAVTDDDREQPEADKVPDTDRKQPVEKGNGVSTDPLTQWAANHATLLLTVALFVLVVIRVLRVSAFDPATAAALVREIGIVSIVIGALVLSLPGLLQSAAVFLAFLALGGPGSTVQRRAASTIASVIVLLLSVVLPWLQLIFFLILLVLIVVVWRRVKWPLELFAVVAVLVSSLLDVSEVWLPPEDVLLTDGRRVTGYVLSVEPEWTTLLREDDRAILLVKTKEVEERSVCNVERVPTTRSIGQIILGERGGARNPPCPAEERTGKKPDSTSNQ